MSSASLDIGIPCRRIDRQLAIIYSEAITNSTCCVTLVKISNEKRVSLWLRQKEHIRDQLWHRYSKTIDQIMVPVVKDNFNQTSIFARKNVND
jgi:hypothetical protein